MNQKVLVHALVEMARLQGHEFNGQDRLLIRTKTAAVLAAKQLHRQRMEAPLYQWRKPDKIRR